jgi:hypothetical protein
MFNNLNKLFTFPRKKRFLKKKYGNQIRRNSCTKSELERLAKKILISTSVSDDGGGGVGGEG